MRNSLSQDLPVFRRGYSSSHCPRLSLRGGDHSVVGGECCSNERCWVDLFYVKSQQHISLDLMNLLTNSSRADKDAEYVWQFPISLCLHEKLHIVNIRV